MGTESRLTDHLRLGRLTRFYDSEHDQLPRVMHTEAIDPASLRLRRYRGDVTAARAWMFGLPSGQVVAALTLDLAVTLVGTLPALEDAYYLEITVEEAALAQHFADMVQARGVTVSEPSLEQERHQLVFAAAQGTDGPELDDAIQRVVYRTDLPYRPESAR